VRSREIVVPEVGRFRVLDGVVTAVETADRADPVEVQACLDGRVSAVCWQQRRILPLHLAAVTLDEAAVGFAGPPGSGKSSVATALADRGHPLLCDDLAPVSYDETGWPTLGPTPSPLRIWGASARGLGWPTDDEHRIKPGVDKYAYDQPGRFAAGRARLGAVYVLVEHAGGEVLVDRLRGFAAFEVLFAGATYAAEYLDTPDDRAWHFTQVLRIADRVPVFTVRRPAGEIPLNRVADEIERHALVGTGV
jgi:hypothetical protein